MARVWLGFFVCWVWGVLVGGTERQGKRRRRVEGVGSGLDGVQGRGDEGGVGGDEDVDGGWGMRSDGWWWGVWVGLYCGSWAKLGCGAGRWAEGGTRGVILFVVREAVTQK